MVQSQPFDPTRHLSLISGNEYLEVKWRLVWFRSEHPNGSIETELLSLKDNVAVFKATIRTDASVDADPNTGEVNTVLPGRATGHGMEDAQSFGDYMEKAETKAIGRALAALGFGTQFTYDFDFGNGERVVDAPVNMQQRRENQVPANYSGQPSRGASGLGATEKQMSLIQSLGRDVRLDLNGLNELAEEQTGHSLDALSRKDASALIDYMQELRKERGSVR
jgi:hypothetical protein